MAVAMEFAHLVEKDAVDAPRHTVNRKVLVALAGAAGVATACSLSRGYSQDDATARALFFRGAKNCDDSSRTGYEWKCNATEALAAGVECPTLYKENEETLCWKGECEKGYVWKAAAGQSAVARIGKAQKRRDLGTCHQVCKHVSSGWSWKCAETEAEAAGGKCPKNYKENLCYEGECADGYDWIREPGQTAVSDWRRKNLGNCFKAITTTTQFFETTSTAFTACKNGCINCDIESPNSCKPNGCDIRRGYRQVTNDSSKDYLKCEFVPWCRATDHKNLERAKKACDDTVAEDVPHTECEKGQCRTLRKCDAMWKCEVECEEGKYMDNGKCKKCATGCVDCTEGQACKPDKCGNGYRQVRDMDSDEYLQCKEIPWCPDTEHRDFAAAHAEHLKCGPTSRGVGRRLNMVTSPVCKEGECRHIRDCARVWTCEAYKPGQA